MKTKVSRILIVPVLLLAACGQTPSSSSSGDRPAASAEPPASAGQRTGDPTAEAFEIDRARSELLLKVMRAGPLARFGHNHVIGGPVITGTIYLAPELEDSFFLIEVDLAAMEVDRPAWRQAAGSGFESVPDPEDIEGTRENMLGEKVLDVTNWPTATVRSSAILGNLPDFSILASITLKGETRPVPVPVRLETEGSRLLASGQFTLTQSQFGIDPFSILLGAISVQDDIQVSFSIVADRSGPDPQH